MKVYNIAIDGPAGAGKSTVAKLAAKRLGFIYVDTGAMYRAMGLFIKEKGILPQDEQAVSDVCGQADITITYENGEQQVYLNGNNVNGRIRTEEAGKLASVTSAYKAVRARLVELQKELAANNSVIMDGRDIGTKVLPKADLKIYLVADSLKRAERRYKELTAKGIVCDINEIQKDIIARDEADMSRKESPLCKAEDAYLLDTSNLTADEAAESIIAMFNQRCNKS